MVLLTDCIACRYGDHAGHAEVIQSVPEGMLGGKRCPCTGDCAERYERRRAASSRPCPCCEGAGCEECDGTGRRYRVGFQTEDGVRISVSGSGQFNPALKDAFLALAEAAEQHMREVDPDV